MVDDDPSARKGFARLLRTAGHEVRAFASTNEFLEALGSEACECVVLDARMPGISGEELQAKLKECFTAYTHIEEAKLISVFMMWRYLTVEELDRMAAVKNRSVTLSTSPMRPGKTRSATRN